mgnify:CR=1 FL=1
MKLTINDNKTIEQIQDEFNQAFQYLKIEFFKKAHEVGEASAKKDLLDSEQTLGEIRTVHNDGELTITADMLVSDVETAFEDNFGVHVQVFRKQNDVWLETTNTDGWTLSKQMETAEFMGKPVEE